MSIRSVVPYLLLPLFSINGISLHYFCFVRFIHSHNIIYYTTLVYSSIQFFNGKTLVALNWVTIPESWADPRNKALTRHKQTCRSPGVNCFLFADSRSIGGCANGTCLKRESNASSVVQSFYFFLVHFVRRESKTNDKIGAFIRGILLRF